MEPDRAVDRLGRIDQLHPQLLEPRLILPQHGLDRLAKLLAILGRDRRGTRHVGDAVIDQRLLQMLQLRCRGDAADPRVEEVLQVAPHRLLQVAQQLVAAPRRLAANLGLVVDQPVEDRREQWLVGPDLGHMLSFLYSPLATVDSPPDAEKVTVWISRIEVASSPTRKVRWPTPRTGVPSPPRQSVARPSRSMSSVSAAEPG